MASLISVIVLFYGVSYSKRLELVAESVLSQKGVNVDFIIAGFNNATRINRSSDLSKHPKENLHDIIRTGKVINNGLRIARGEFVYISDADILLQNQNYLERLIQEHLYSGNSLKRPLMKRLLLQDFEWFYSQVSTKGLEKAVASLDKSQEYIVKPKGAERPMKIFPKFERGKQKIFIASESDFHEYISSEENKGSEPRYFNQDRHCGAVFARTDHLIEIGGYHEGFVSWGVWDADVQWKLESQGGIKPIPYEDEFSVIHLDHERGHFSKLKWEHDKKLQEKRRALGFEKCVEKDKRAYLGGENEY